MNNEMSARFIQFVPRHTGPPASIYLSYSDTDTSLHHNPVGPREPSRLIILGKLIILGRRAMDGTHCVSRCWVSCGIFIGVLSVALCWCSVTLTADNADTWECTCMKGTNGRLLYQTAV